MNRHRTHGSASAARVAAVAVAVLVGACSSGDEDASTPSTTQPPSTSTVGAADVGGAGPTTSELAAILPRAIDLGEDWVEMGPPGTDGSPTDLAIEEQCPELAGLIADDARPTDDDGHVVRTFVDPDGREIEIELDPNARTRRDAEVKEAVDATNACGEIAVDDGAGVATTLRFQAAIDPDHGEQAVKLQAEVAVTLPDQDEPISLTLYGLVFRTGPVGVRVTATDGLDRDSLDVHRSDTDLLAALSDRLEASVDDLVG